MNKAKIQSIKKTIKQKQDELLDFCRLEFKNGTKELFDENPDLESFGFGGWIPYFNDGESCEFSAHTDYPDINGESGYDIEYGEKLEHLLPLFKKIRKFLSAFDDVFYRKLFGDHFKVVITKDNIEVEKYTDHD